MQLDLTLGEPITTGSLTLVPLCRPSPSADPGYLPGPDAFRAGVIHVAERDGVAVVPELQVVVDGALPVLLIEGEAILGAQQNRVLNVSAVLPAAADTVVPVSCVEAGRWGRPMATRRSARHSPTGLRRTKTRSVAESVRRTGARHSDQGAVWDEVDDLMVTYRSASPSAALEHVYETVAPRLDEVLEGLEPCDDQVGVVVLTSGRVAALDLFDHPRTLRAYWDQLVNGYGLDALDRDLAEVDAEDLIAEAERFLAEVAAASVDRTPGAGEGTDVVLDGDHVVGLGVEWHDRLRHLAAFPT